MKRYWRSAVYLWNVVIIIITLCIIIIIINNFKLYNITTWWWSAELIVLGLQGLEVYVICFC